MGMLEWAKKEIEIAKKRERGDKPECEWDYGCACYDSAFKAFKSLCEDGHSGFSINMTKQILNRMIDGKPLIPIEDIEDVWGMCCRNEEDGKKSFQCKRMSSLFKDVFPDGRIEYHDNNRFTGVDAKDGGCWHNGLFSAIGGELYPITMPYMPEDKPYKVYFEECLTDVKNGDFDTEAILYIITPDGERVEINRYFREPHEGEEPTYHGWVEISMGEWLRRKLMDQKRKEALSEG